MNTIYRIQVRTKDMKQAADMLRYDRAYDALILRSEPPGQNLMEVKTLRFTRGRWESFLVPLRSVTAETVKDQEFNDLAEQAKGFVAGLRAAGALLDAGLVEGPL